MKVVFCVTCKGRVRHLAQTLPSSLAGNPEAHFVVLSYNDRDGLSDYIKDCHGEAIQRGQLSFYEYREDVPFRMAHAKNMAHRCGMMEGADVLVNLDADNYAGDGFARWITEQLVAFPNAYLWSKMVKGEMPRGVMGRIVISRQAFLMSGGYDEKYDTHSPDDRDMKARLDLLGLDGREVAPRFLQAIPHSDKLRFKEYPHVTPDGEFIPVVNPVRGIANFGNVGCGEVYRNFSDVPFMICRFPTRVWGIGMHKTGTTSLHTAMELLGFKSAHWIDAHWSRSVWEQMTAAGRSPVLEQFYTACDLPMPLLYRQLDLGYPGSKFILTMRDEAKWLKSVENHWNPKVNPNRHWWDIAPFSHKMHNLIYGRKTFDADTMLGAYRRHNADVRQYFRGRERDLLVFNVDDGDGFSKLCHFLNVPIPNAPFPHMLKTK